MRRISIIILYLLILASICNAEVAEEHWFEAGSKFIVVSPNNLMPEIVVLYNNTRISFDINYDGMWDYSLKSNQNEILKLEFPWQIRTGTLLIADKPIIYKQKISEFHQYSFHKEYYSIIPPYQNLAAEYLVYSGIWELFSKGNITVHNLKTGTTDHYSGQKRISTTDITRISSTDKLIIVSDNSIACPVGKSFFAHQNDYIFIAGEETNVSIDYNGDGIIDDVQSYDIGKHSVKVTPGALIISNKNISSYGYYALGGTYAWYSYPSGIPARTVNNEIIFPKMDPSYLVGISDSHYIIQSNGSKELGNISNNSIERVTVSNIGRLISDKPIIAYQNLTESGRKCPYGNCYNYMDNYVSTPYPYASVYADIFIEDKPIKPDSLTSLKARIFNSYQETDVFNISFGLELNSYFQSLGTEIIIEKKRLSDDKILESQTIIKPLFFDGSYKLYLNYADSQLLNLLKGEEYIEIDLVFLAPASSGVYRINGPKISYDAQTWIIPN